MKLYLGVPARDSVTKTALAIVVKRILHCFHLRWICCTTSCEIQNANKGPFSWHDLLCNTQRSAVLFTASSTALSRWRRTCDQHNKRDDRADRRASCRFVIQQIV